jgi:hypothetical protein
MQRHKKGWLLKVVGALIVASGSADAQHGGRHMGPMHGGPAAGHDSATRADMMVIHQMLANHDRITRSVSELPNGIRTVTESTDSVLARLIKDHVATMYQRIASGKDPGWPMESDALRLLYKNSALIQTQIDLTSNGIMLVQTSSDSVTVVALQTHAAEVTALVRGGMGAMHGAMMQRRGSMMRHGHPPMDSSGIGAVPMLHGRRPGTR